MSVFPQTLGLFETTVTDRLDLFEMPSLLHVRCSLLGWKPGGASPIDGRGDTVEPSSGSACTTGGRRGLGRHCPDLQRQPFHHQPLWRGDGQARARLAHLATITGCARWGPDALGTKAILRSQLIASVSPLGSRASAVAGSHPGLGGRRGRATSGGLNPSAYSGDDDNHSMQLRRRIQTD